MKISGKFDVDVKPQNAYTSGRHGIQLGRLSIDKQFFGELEASSKGEMLSAMTPVKGSAGYVAIEQVCGTLNGMAGSFVLQHFGTMDQGKDRLILEVVPGSGTDQLTGMTGSMLIKVEAGQHFYEFDYNIQEKTHV